MENNNLEKKISWKNWLIKKLLSSEATREEVLNYIATNEENSNLDKLEDNNEKILIKNILNLNDKSVEDVIKQANNRLKSNGYLLLSEPAFNFLKGKHSETVQTKRRFTKHKLEKIIYRSGFKKIIISTYWGYTIFFLMLMKRRIFEPIFGTNLNSERTDLFNIPIVDDILFWLTRFESILIKEMNIPFGTSVVILAKK